MGTMVENVNFNKYTVQLDKSGRLTISNLRFLWSIRSYKKAISRRSANKDKVKETAMEAAPNRTKKALTWPKPTSRAATSRTRTSKNLEDQGDSPPRGAHRTVPSTSRPWAELGRVAPHSDDVHRLYLTIYYHFAGTREHLDTAAHERRTTWAPGRPTPSPLGKTLWKTVVIH